MAATLLEPLRAGTNAYVGSQWDFGAVALTADGDIPDTAPRRCFGDDPQVYRAFKYYDYDAQQWVHAFSPPPVRDVQAGEIVKAVTGTWEMTITDGSTPESYPSIVTLYDALSAIQTTSALVRSLTPATNDRKPNGQAVTDLSVWTQSFVLSITADGSRAVQQAEIGLTVLEAAPTEQLSIRCTSNATVGAELWAVQGPISGALANATTGVAYADGPYAFTIPVQLPPATAPGGDISVVFTGRDAEGDEDPIMCVDRALLGANAQNGSFRFVWTKKPKPCVCTDELSDLVNYECLGLEAEGGGPVTVNAVRLRKQRLVTAARGFIEGNTTPPETVDAGDIEWINTSADILASALAQLDGDGATLTYDAWQASHVYAEGVTITGPGAASEYRFLCLQGGTSASSDPTFPTTPDDDITDGNVVWVNLGKLPLLAFDDAFEDWKTDAGLLSGQENPQNYPLWSPGTMVYPGTIIAPSQQQDFYLFLTGYVDNSGNPVAPPDNETPTGSLEPIWDTTPDAYTTERSGDVYIKWQAKSYDELSVQKGVSDAFYERYRAQMKDVLFAAGIDANFESASTAGSPCWRDFADNDYWFVSVDGYKPMQLHHPYYSVKDGTDEDGRPIIVPTNEFAVFLEWGCADRLLEGDLVTINIGNVSGGIRTYQTDDELTASIAHADPVPFGGGQSGDDTLTFSVSGSVDGAFADYALVLTAPTPYSDGGLEFAITAGGIAFALGDTFRFSSVGGHFQWRQNGGSWTGPVVIGDAALVDGLAAVFTGGAQDPTWATGDTFSFSALAINGVDQVMSPADGRLTWTGSTTITVVPADNGPASRFAAFDHHIPSDAVITLEGSDDNFSTTPTSVVIPWTARDLLAVFDAVTRLKWRLTVDKGGDIFWAFLGPQMQPTNPKGGADLGLFKKRRRLPGIGVRSALSGDVTHDVTGQTSFEDFMAGVDYACANDDRSFGIVVNESLSEMSLVRLDAADIEVSDLFDFQPTDPTPNRCQSFTLKVDARP
jgi:hypothetical protein